MQRIAAHGACGSRPLYAPRARATCPKARLCRSLARPLRGWAGELVSASTGRTTPTKPPLQPKRMSGNLVDIAVSSILG
jgi:hypothetical protein